MKREKKKKTFTMVDAHCHIGLWPKFYIPDGSPKGLLSLMNHLGVHYAINSHLFGLLGMYKQASDEAKVIYEKSEGRILSYLVWNPNHGRESLKFIETNLSYSWFAGIKIHPTQHNCPADDEKYRSVWRFAHLHRIVLLTHSWDRSSYHPEQNYSYPHLFEKYIAEYENAKVILGHAGGRYQAHLICIRLAKNYPNVYVDMAADGFLVGRLPFFVNEISSRKILFGSDAPWTDPRLFLGEILGADISDLDRENILGRNALKLFNFPKRHAI